MDSRDSVIEELRALVARQAAQLEQQAKRIAELELALAKANKDSSTSSKPPSSDITKPQPKKAPGRRKKPRRGGQPGHQAQYCWAHLIRDIRFLQEKHPDRKTKVWAEQLLDRSRRLFSAWHRRDELTEEGFHRSMITHRDRFLELVRNSPSTKEATNLAARFALVDYSTDDSPELQQYDLSQDYFRFMFAEGVEPTNNHSEQQIRHCVIDRRITQGTRGEAGQRYHERMWTAIATCKKQHRNFFSFLLESIRAQLDNKSAPTLLNA